MASTEPESKSDSSVASPGLAGDGFFLSQAVRGRRYWSSLATSLGLHVAVVLILPSLSSSGEVIQNVEVASIEPIQIRIPSRLAAPRSSGGGGANQDETGGGGGSESGESGRSGRRGEPGKAGSGSPRSSPGRAAKPALRPFELPQIPVNALSSQTILQPIHPPDLPLQEEVKLPQILLWAQNLDVPPPPLREFVEPGSPRPSYKLPEFEAPPKLELPNKEITATDLKIGSSPLFPNPRLPAPPANVVPLRTFVPPEDTPRRVAEAAIIEPMSGTAANLLAVSSEPAPLSELITVPAGNQLGIPPPPPEEPSAVAGTSAEGAGGREGAETAFGTGAGGDPGGTPGGESGPGGPGEGGSGPGGAGGRGGRGFGGEGTGTGGGGGGTGPGSGPGSGTAGAGPGGGAGGTGSGAGTGFGPGSSTGSGTGPGRGTGSGSGSGSGGGTGSGTGAGSGGGTGGGTGSGTGLGSGPDSGTGVFTLPGPGLPTSVETRIEHPETGVFDVVIIGAPPVDGLSEHDNLLSGEPVYTVYLDVGDSRNWLLQYCIPEQTSGMTIQGSVITLGAPAPVKAPYPRITVLPPRDEMLFGRRAVIHGYLDSNGKFRDLQAAYPSQGQPYDSLLSALEEWLFRPAVQSGAPVEIEILLVVPLHRP